MQIASASGAGNFPPWYNAGKVWLDEHPSFPFRKSPLAFCQLQTMLLRNQRLSKDECWGGGTQTLYKTETESSHMYCDIFKDM